MTVVTRFPPSPTGRMHIGNARTMLYNWYFARRNKGQIRFRVEDTDRARYEPEFVEALINGITWLGLDWDGEIFSQWERRERHAEIARKLVDEGKAYYCYCSPEELEAMREEAKVQGRPVAYDRRWRDRDPSEAPKDVKPVIRIKSPLTGDSVVQDEVQGEIRVAYDHIDDMILLRSDGSPTYMLSVVVDDHDMGVTHVIRGDDHMNNTFRQNLIYDAMGWEKPVYAHLPLILGNDGKKLSKRHGAQSVEEFRDMGYLPEAMRNYLLKLGWGHGDDEIISDAQALEWFDLDGINQSAARFDFDKLNFLNKHYMREADAGRIMTLLEPVLKDQYGVRPDVKQAQWIKEALPDLIDRADTLVQLAAESLFFCRDDASGFDDKAKDALDKEVLTALTGKFKQLDTFTPETIQAACKEVADTLRDGKLGKVGMPLRAALTGTTSSPSIFHMAAIMGREEVLKRLEKIS